jgi:FixJ family two-component response regulator
MPNDKLHVAIVDDDESVRKALARLLSAHSFKTHTYGSAQEFLTSLRVNTPECLVLDLHMPDISGLDLQHHLARTGIRIPTVVITAHNEIGLRERCKAAGAAEFLVKPLNASILIGAIQVAVSRPASQPPTGSLPGLHLGTIRSS